MTHTGSCRCGQVAAEIAAEPTWRSYCHCDDCRRQTGAPVSAFVGFHEADVAWRGEPRLWQRDGITRSFCGTCGSQIGYVDAGLPGEVYLMLGFLDEPQRLAPAVHAFEDRRLPFLDIRDDLPRFDSYSIERR